MHVILFLLSTSPAKMVRIHAKHGQTSDQNQFLYDCASSSQIDEIALELSRISKLQAKIHALVHELEPILLPFHGDTKGIIPTKPEIALLFLYLYKPLSHAFCSQAALPLVRALSEANSYASKVNPTPCFFFVELEHINYEILGFHCRTRWSIINPCLIMH